MIWWRVSVPLSLYGFFKEYRPSEPFISSYLVGPWKNFTKEEVNQDIYPLGTYFNLALLAIVFLLTDLLRYKPVIVAGGFSAVACWSTLRWGTTLQEMQVLEFFYAFFMASEVAYFTYIYAKVDPKHYQMVTSHTRAAFLLGKAGAGLSSQLLVNYSSLDYEQLNYFTIAGVGTATLCGLALPSVPTSIYFHRDTASEIASLGAGDPGGDGATHRTGSRNGLTPNNEVKVNRLTYGDAETKTGSKTSWTVKWGTAFRYLWDDFLHAFTNTHVRKWSIWWAFATCGYLQVTSYSQLLWEEIKGDDDLLNGYVEFGYSLVGAMVAFSVGYLDMPWDVVGELFLAVVSLVQGALMVYSGFLDNLIVAYAVYIIFGILYQSAITIASSEVAKYIREDSYALVFGVNFFLALVMQTILTLVVIEALQATIRTQFKVYGGYYLLIGLGFCIAGAITFCSKSRKADITRSDSALEAQ